MKGFYKFLEKLFPPSGEGAAPEASIIAYPYHLPYLPIVSPENLKNAGKICSFSRIFSMFSILKNILEKIPQILS